MKLLKPYLDTQFMQLARELETPSLESDPTCQLSQIGPDRVSNRYFRDAV